MYNLVKEWEPEDLTIPTEGYMKAATSDEDAKERVFRKTCHV